jgi:zinc/manganese transport system substrate-binding protein
MQLMAPLSVRWPSLRDHFLPAVIAVGAAGAVVAGGVPVGSLAASPADAGSGRSQATIAAVAAENQYANVISQIGGRYVTVTAIMSNPNTDPHEFEASAGVAVQVSQNLRRGPKSRQRLVAVGFCL